MNSGLGRAMRSGDVALRLSAVFAMAGLREKSSSETVTTNLTEMEQRSQKPQ